MQSDTLKKLQDHFENDWQNERDIYKWLVNHTNIPYLKLDIKIPWQDIYKEALAVQDQFVVHRKHEGGETWKSACLHGVDTKTTNDWKANEYKDKGWTEQPEMKWTSLSEQCPITTDFFKNQFPYSSYDRLRFMWIEPGGYILPHQDLTERHFAPVNISIYNPEGCEFRFKNWGTVPFTHGSAFLIDVGQSHCVWNRSNEPRLHMIAHGSKDWDRFIPMLERSWQNR